MKEKRRRRKNGLCARPGCQKPLPTVTPAMRKYAGAQIDLDPYCSTACCKLDYGVEIVEKYVDPDKAERIAMYDNSDDNRRRRARIRAAGNRLPNGHTYSVANYRNGCYCDGCREAHRIWQREWRAKKRTEKVAA